MGQGMGLLNQLTHACPTGPSRTYYDAIQESDIRTTSMFVV